MIAVEKDLVVCEKHHYSHYGEFAVCPYCQAEKAERDYNEAFVDAEGYIDSLTAKLAVKDKEIAELREEHEQWHKES